MREKRAPLPQSSRFEIFFSRKLSRPCLNLVSGRTSHLFPSLAYPPNDFPLGHLQSSHRSTSDQPHDNCLSAYTEEATSGFWPPEDRVLGCLNHCGRGSESKISPESSAPTPLSPPAPESSQPGEVHFLTETIADSLS